MNQACRHLPDPLNSKNQTTLEGFSDTITKNKDSLHERAYLVCFLNCQLSFNYRKYNSCRQKYTSFKGCYEIKTNYIGRLGCTRRLR